MSPFAFRLSTFAFGIALSWAAPAADQAQGYPARHGAILLPFDAAIAALEERAAGA